MKKFILLFVLLFTITGAFTQTIIWDESVDGDLQGDSGNDATIFQMVTLVEGVNIIRGSIGNTSFNGPDGTVDAFNFIIPEGGTVTTFDISSFMLGNNNDASYVGAYVNGVLSMGGAVSGPQSYLSNFGGGPLLSGTFGISINEVTTDGAIYEFSITYVPPSAVVPTLSQWGFLILSLLLIIVAVHSIKLSHYEISFFLKFNK